MDRAEDLTFTRPICINGYLSILRVLSYVNAAVTLRGSISIEVKPTIKTFDRVRGRQIREGCLPHGGSVESEGIFFFYRRV